MAQRTVISAVVTGYGDVDRLSFREHPRAVPAAGEVAVQVVAAGVSHMDAYIRQGRFRDRIDLDLPAGEGSSFAGIVRGVGDGVRGLKIDDEVLGHDPAHSAHSTRIVVPATAVVRKPARLSWEVAAALYLPGLTAYELTQSLRLGPDDVVVVSAAAGGVGHIECQIARLAGARVLGIAGKDNHDYLRSIGVRPVAYGDDPASAVVEAAGGRPVTALLDNYGGYEDLAAALDLPAGRFVPSDSRRDVEVRLWSDPGDPRTALQLRDVAELVAEWNIRVLVSGYYPFTALDRALADLDARHSRGVVVVGMNPTAPAREYLRGKLRTLQESSPAPAGPGPGRRVERRADDRSAGVDQDGGDSSLSASPSG